MATKTEKELAPREKEMWLKALSAIELKNYGYAVSLLDSVLKAEPAFLDGRKLMRKAQIGATKGKKKLLGNLGGSSLNISGLRNKGKIEKDPEAAMVEAEKILSSDPASTSGNRLLYEAAEAAELPEVATFALETLVEANSKDIKIMHELAKYYLLHEQPQKALDTYNKIVEIKPNDLEAIKGGKDASAAVSMSSGGWTEAESYRDVMKNKDEAVSLEQQSKVVRSEQGIDQLLAELGEKYQEDNQNVEVVRKIASLYEQKGDLENAVTWYQYAGELSGGTDSNLVRKASDLRVKLLDRKIDELDKASKQAEESGAQFEQQEEFDQLKAERAELVISESRKRVERNPTDLALRFELGEQLYLSGHYKQAMPELQKAKQSSNLKIKAANLLGQCMVQNNMLDMASKQFEEAIGGLDTMDSAKKELLYNLGITFEKMGRNDDYVDCMKQIYETDMSYRDVAKRVEDSYQQ